MKNKSVGSKSNQKLDTAFFASQLSELDKLQSTAEKLPKDDKRRMLLPTIALGKIVSNLSISHYKSLDQVKDIASRSKQILLISLVALVLSFRDLLMALIKFLFGSLTSYVMNGVDMYQQLTVDQKFNTLYLVPVGLVFSYLMYLVGRSPNKKK